MKYINVCYEKADIPKKLMRKDERYMVRLTPSQWLKKALEICVSILAFSEPDNMQIDWKTLENEYQVFDLSERHEIHRLFREQLAAAEGVYVVSCLINYTKIQDFWDDLVWYLLRDDFDCFTSSMLEIQLGIYNSVSYAEMCKIHRKNVKCIAREVGINFPWIEQGKRNSKRIVIITEQLLLGTRHAPTKVVLDFARLLQKNLGYEVRLFICPSNRVLAHEVWIKTFGYHGETERKYIQISDRGEEIDAWCFPMAGCSTQDYAEMLSLIYEWKPLFVLNMGVNNPVADLPRMFTTLVAMGMTIECPVSEADILIRYIHKEPQYENEYMKALKPYQKQIFMEEKLPAIIQKAEKQYTRLELGLPQEKFLVAVVGNRLDIEIDQEFVQVMRQILLAHSEVMFVIIGLVEKLPEYLNDKIFQNRVYYLGYCRDLIGTYSVLNLYLNPRRIGGGWSSAIALAAGIPVLTLPECDVAYNVGEDFIVNNYKELLNEMACYVSDSKFYETKRKKALLVAESFGEEKMVAYITKLVAKIKETMENDSI